ncbi:MAG: hypothetical protein MRY72_11795 [Aquisalinus sp.]|nr:hypothetical protein [Aquisalinus sp.]
MKAESTNKEALQISVPLQLTAHKPAPQKARPRERREAFLENVADCAQGMKTDIQLAVMCAYIRISTYKKQQYVPELQVGIRGISSPKKDNANQLLTALANSLISTHHKQP